MLLFTIQEINISMTQFGLVFDMHIQLVHRIESFYNTNKFETLSLYYFNEFTTQQISKFTGRSKTSKTCYF